MTAFVLQGHIRQYWEYLTKSSYYYYFLSSMTVNSNAYSQAWWWGCMSAASSGDLQFIEGTMNANMYCDILKQSMIPSLRRLGRRAVFQRDNDPKHTSKMTTALRGLRQCWKILMATQNIDTLGPIWTFSLRGALTFVSSGLDINVCVLSYFEGDSKFTPLYKLYTHYFTL